MSIFNHILPNFPYFFSSKQAISENEPVALEAPILKNQPKVLSEIIYNEGFNGKKNYVIRKSIWEEGKLSSVTEKVYLKKVPKDIFLNIHNEFLISVDDTNYSYYENTDDQPMVKGIFSTYWIPPNRNKVTYHEFKEGEQPMPSKEKIAVIDHQAQDNRSTLRSVFDYIFPFFASQKNEEKKRYDDELIGLETQELADLTPHFSNVELSEKAPTCTVSFDHADESTLPSYLSSAHQQ
ncbi:hypothetical protein [Candidatus Hamiltonella defensa]|uniref:Uncharacterized protein n=1 Tax=Hamiltonella defensa subsp. Acyrthosiphon pisum (strain 5AT) TaxID=572265 RepID=C4K8X1_HAMD5|nr:hypothetical protein [Candidatus Hamiltonella defensa]ACQ68840.1 hypothetical protein HDEF_2302 [Candidatus Hamiltonella defensa 5AT (Acyrthosiphon pisum)]ATW23345.1 hypothetical protein BJP44_10185 [Candidatus Hamiltonella defensa]